MTGDVTYFDKRLSKPLRAEWQRLAKGDARQHFEERDPTTGRWKTCFTGRYKRKPQ